MCAAVIKRALAAKQCLSVIPHENNERVVFNTTLDKELHDLPESHREGPAYLNVLRTLDLPQAVALAGERTRVVLYQPEAKYDDFPLQVAEALGFGPKAISLRKSMSGD